MYQRLLLAHDGSELADTTVPRVAALAAPMSAEVLVVRVSHAAGTGVEELTEATWAERIARGGAEMPGEAREEAFPPLSDTVAALRAAGVEHAGSLVLHGEPEDAIVGAAERFGCDLIAMSTHGLSGIRRAVLGSVAGHVIRHARTPVLLSRSFPQHVGDPQRAGGGYRTVLVALDGSPQAESSLPHARGIAAATGARVVVVQVVDSAFDLLTMSTPAGYPIPAGITAEAAEDAVRAQRETVETELQAAVEQLRVEAPSAEWRVLEGAPGDAIVAAADDLDVDLVVMASHGRGRVERVLLGSVTDHVSRNLSSAAALIIPSR